MRRGMWAGLGLMCCVWFTSQRLLVWQSDRTLWTQAASVTPLKPRAVLNRAAAEMRAGDWIRGCASSLRALELIHQPNRRAEHDKFEVIIDAQLTYGDLWHSGCSRPSPSASTAPH